jgi:hypothetical protein
VSADPVVRASVDQPPPAREHRWVPVLAVVAVIALVAGGGALAGATRDEAAPAPQVVGGTVRIRPLPGWAASEPPGAPLPEVVLTRASATLDVLAVPGSPGSPDDLADTYVERILRPRFEDLEIGQAAAGTLPSGHPAIRFGYVGVAGGVAIEGILVAVRGDAAGAIFDASAPKGDLAWVASDVNTMIDDAEVA